MEHLVGYYKAEYHYEKVPENLQAMMAELYMSHRNEVADIFNEHIDEVNHQWELLGKPCAFGDYIEDMNPEYVNFIKDSIQPYVDRFNSKLSSYCMYRIGEYADIEGYLPFLPGSRIWVTFREVKGES